MRRSNKLWDRILIGPDAKRHMCVSKMIRQAPDGHVAVSADAPSMECHEYGMCSPCDEVAQIRFLDGESKPIEAGSGKP
jgi:hypothetical protein